MRIADFVHLGRAFVGAPESSRDDRFPVSTEGADTPPACTARGGRGRRGQRSSMDASHCGTSWPGSHIIRSMLTLSNPAARAIATASTARRAEWRRPRRAQLGVTKRLNAEAQTIDTGAAKLFQTRVRNGFRIGLEGDLGAGGERRRRASGFDDRADFGRGRAATACRRRSTECQGRGVRGKG